MNQIRKVNFDAAETILGVVLLVVLILGSLLSLVLVLPKEEDAKKIAKPLQKIDRNFFDINQNEVSKKIEKLRVPDNVPVEVDQDNLGRGNVFDKY